MILHDRIQQAVAKRLEEVEPPNFGNVLLTVQLDYHGGKAVGHVVDSHVHETTRY